MIAGGGRPGRYCHELRLVVLLEGERGGMAGPTFDTPMRPMIKSGVSHPDCWQTRGQEFRQINRGLALRIIDDVTFLAFHREPAGGCIPTTQKVLTNLPREVLAKRSSRN